MTIIIFALLSGVLFGVGLTVSRMIDPSKVIGFLDVTGAWDPSLAFVMGGALLVTVPAFMIAKKRVRTLLNIDITMPTKNDIDASLLIGAAIFGVGWGLGGFCPGPAISALSFGLEKPLIFVTAMTVGMFGFGLFRKKADGLNG
tara:strand:+ start:4991 stop:5422 length:432 start_codon:yes stop_codon:yes gene_type:complete